MLQDVADKLNAFALFIDTSIKVAVNRLSNDLRRSFLGRYLGHSSRQADQVTGDIYENAAAICEV